MKLSSTQVQTIIHTVAAHESDGNGWCFNPACGHNPVESPWPNHVGVKVVQALEKL